MFIPVCRGLEKRHQLVLLGGQGAVGEELASIHQLEDIISLLSNGGVDSVATCQYSHNEHAETPKPTRFWGTIHRLRSLGSVGLPCFA